MLLPGPSRNDGVGNGNMLYLTLDSFPNLITTFPLYNFGILMGLFNNDESFC